MKKIEVYGAVTDEGALKISYRDRFIEALKGFKGKRVKIIVEPLYKKRSARLYHDDGRVTGGENGYFHGVVVREYINGAWAEQGRIITMAEAKEELMANCGFIERYNEDTGEVMRTFKSTSMMTTSDFEEYMDKCRAFILEWFNIGVPLPNQGQLEANLKL